MQAHLMCCVSQLTKIMITFLKKYFIFIYLNYFTILLRSKESTKMETLQTGH